MPNIDPYRNFNFRVELSSTSSATAQPADLVITAVDTNLVAGDEISLKTGQASLMLPAVQKVRVATGDVNGDGIDHIQSLRSPADPRTIALLLPAVQKVREAARRNTSAASRTTPGPSWGTYILPYMEQDNIHKFQNLVRRGGGGAVALGFSGITDGTSNTLSKRGITSNMELWDWVRIRSARGDFTALLERAIVKVEAGDSNQPPMILIGFSSSRLS